MPKKKNDEERKPDLNEADNQAEIEARIKEMMELDEPASKAKPTVQPDGRLASAPEIPEAKKPVSIKIVDHNESPKDETPLEAEHPETDPDVMAAIEEANKQLLNTSFEEPDTDEKPVTAPIADTDNTDDEAPAEAVPTAPELEVSEDDSLINEAGTENELRTDDELQDEEDPIVAAFEEPQKNVDIASTETAIGSKESKEKPLKHLDSIVPKTKVSETIESTSTDKAVDDIIAKEADELLNIQDEKAAAQEPAVIKQHPPKKRDGFLRRKTVLRGIMLLLLVGLAAAAAVPSSRYFLMNSAGIRSQASILVLDQSTQQPLKDVTVKIGALEQKTNQEGRASFTSVKLGPTRISVEKRAFAAVTKDHTIGWGSNPLADVSLEPTGSQYRFIVTDFLSGKPVAKVEAVSKEASAISNEKGEIKLTIDQQDDAPREVSISGENYRIETFALNLDQKEPVDIRLVPSRKHVFISNRAGKFDVFKVDIDGKNEALVLPGTGSEREDMVLIPHPTDEVAALVSTKDNKRNKDGFLLSTLTVMNLGEETAKSVVTSERVQIIDWIGSRIVYVQIKEGASGDSPDRHKLVSFDYKSGEYKDLASSNYFNDVLVADGHIYVAPSSTFSQSTASSLVKMSADGSSKQTIINKEVWNIFRTSYDKLTFAVGQDWYELKLSENQAGKISGEPPTQTSRIYADSADRKRALWVDTRDGKGVLLAYNIESKQDETLRTQAGLKLPVRWLTSSTLVFRINTESETADYALSLDGGEPVKIRDVTNTSGVNTWYYY